MDKRVLAAALVAATLTGCMNLATKPAEITGSYTSELKYQAYSCDQLAAEVNSLARREDQLATAQTQRRKSGKVQAFWLGYGTGDGIEASELANVRGEKEAVRRAMDKAACHAPGQAATSMQAAPQGSPQPASTAPAASGIGNWRSWGNGSAVPAAKPLYRCPAANGGQVVTETPAAGCTVISP